MVDFTTLHPFDFDRNLFNFLVSMGSFHHCWRSSSRGELKDTENPLLVTVTSPPSATETLHGCSSNQGGLHKRENTDAERSFRTWQLIAEDVELKAIKQHAHTIWNSSCTNTAYMSTIDFALSEGICWSPTIRRSTHVSVMYVCFCVLLSLEIFFI